MKAARTKKLHVDSGLVHAEIPMPADGRLPALRVAKREEGYAGVVTIKPKGGVARYFRVSKSALGKVVADVNEDWLNSK